MAKRALVLIDIQNDFLPGGALAVPDGDAVVEVANALMPSFDLVVATRDFHPKGHESFASSHVGRTPGDVIELHGVSQTLWPDHCVQGTAGSKLVDGLHAERIARVFTKGEDPAVDSYSGFFDNGHRRATGLAAWLRGQGVTDLYLMGLATDYCVRFTALDAAELGFETTVIEDGCRGVDLERGDSGRALDEMRARGIEVVRSSAIVVG